MSDLSSLTLHEPIGQLLLLSDESALIVAYAPDGAIYVLSEPNLFYRFERAASPAGS